MKIFRFLDSFRGALESLCPYCGKIVEATPTRKKKCPHCGELMYVVKRNDKKEFTKENDYKSYTEQQATERKQRDLENQLKYERGLEQNRIENLRQYQELDVVKWCEILATKDSCSACRAFSGKRFTIEEALKTKPLPCSECTNDYLNTGKPYCRCTYLPIIE